MDLHQRITFPFYAKNSAFLAHQLKQNGFDISVKQDAETKFKHTIATANNQDFNSIADLKIQRFGVPLISQNIDLDANETIREEVFVLGKIRDVEIGSTIDAVHDAGNLKGFALQIAEPDSYFVQRNELADAKQGAAHSPFGGLGWHPNEPQHRSQLTDMADKGLGTYNKETGFVPDFKAISNNPEQLNNLSASQLSTLHSACLVDMEATYLINKERMSDSEALRSAEVSEAGDALPAVKETYSEKLSSLEKSVETHEERYAAIKAEREEIKSKDAEKDAEAEEEAEA